MLTGKLRNQVDKIWETFWTGGITTPISVIEQFSCPEQLLREEYKQHV